MNYGVGWIYQCTGTGRLQQNINSNMTNPPLNPLRVQKFEDVASSLVGVLYMFRENVLHVNYSFQWTEYSLM